jgi:hypothetical protein
MRMISSSNIKQVLVACLAAAAGSLFAIPPAAAKAPTYAGKWALLHAQCHYPSTNARGPVVMTATTYSQYKTRCNLSSIEAASGVWRADATCRTCAATKTQNLTIWSQSQRLTLQWGLSKKINYVSCK